MLIDFSDQDGFAFDINDNGHILCGQQDYISSGGGYSGPFIWANGRGKTIPVNGLPSAINNMDQVVGTAFGAGGQSFAFLYDNGVADLTNLLSPRPHFQLMLAYDINNNGDITACGFDGNWIPYAVLLTPNKPHFDPHNLVGLIAQILGGLACDGGGSAVIGGFRSPVDPWGWLTETQADTVFAQATQIIEQQFKNDREGLTVAMQSLAKYRKSLGRRSAE